MKQWVSQVFMRSKWSFAALRTQRGNIFFTLFGAVAVVGVLGAGIMATMRGPLTTMVEVNRRTQAETQMGVASKLVLLESIESIANDGDCDVDGFVEPLPFKSAGASPKPTGGGYLPDTVASEKEDPWGTMYGYCVWDAGTIASDTDCGGASQNRLEGNESGDADYVVMLVVSAGPDKSFDTTCTGGSTPSFSRGGDDIATSYTYATAVAASDGLWSLKIGSPDTATIDKELEVTGGASFSGNVDLSASASAQLVLGARSMLLPTESDLLDGDCNGDDPGNNYLIRINTATTPDTLEICDNSNGGWKNVAEGANIWKYGGNPGEIYYNTGNVGIGLTDPAQPLDVSGNIQTSGDVMIGNEQSIVWNGGAGSINGDTDTITITSLSSIDLIGSQTTINTALDVNGDTIMKGSTDTAGADALDVTNNSGASILTVQNDGNVGIGNNTPDDPLSVNGNIDVSGSYEIDDLIVLDNGGQNTTILLGQGVASPVPGTTADYMNLGDAIHADLANKNVGIGFADSYAASGFNDTLEVNGTFDVSGLAKVGGTLDVTGDITGAANLGIVGITASGVIEGDDFTWNGADFTPPTCASNEYITWDGNSWECEEDTAGVGGTGAADLEDILLEGNNAMEQDAQNLGSVGADEYCEDDLTNCFTADQVQTAIDSAIFEINTNVIRTRASASDYAADDFVIGSPTLDHQNNPNYYTRMFFDKSKGAFRVGINSTTVWNDASRGDASIGLGQNVTASGQFSFAAGASAQATGTRSVAIGVQPLASGLYSVAIGRLATSSGDSSLAMGFNTTASGSRSSAFGYEADATGISSVVFGLQNGTQTTNPRVSGNRSMALFFDDGVTDANSGLDITGSDILAIIGGRALIDPTRTQVNVSSGTEAKLELDVEGDIGAIQYCDEEGANCFTAEDIAGGAGGLFENVGNVVRPKSGPVNYATEDFVFGSPQITDDGNTDHDQRMFFDKSKGVFRAGQATGSQWDTNGQNSAAFGYNVSVTGGQSAGFGHTTSASGSTSMVFGHGSQASGSSSFAGGYYSNARGSRSIAIGNYLYAESLNGIAFGSRAEVGQNPGDGLGDYSVVFGLHSQYQSAARVTGDRSFVLYMDEDIENINSNYNITGSDLFAIIGGRALIDPTRTQVNAASGIGDENLELHVEGEIGADQYCDTDGNNCFAATEVGSAPGNDREIIFNDGGVLGTNMNFVFDSAGRMGIGTDAPSSQLHIGTSDYKDPLATGTSGHFSIIPNSVNVVADMGWTSTPIASFFIESKHKTSGSRFPILLNAGGGKVGVGTNSPSAGLHVRSIGTPVMVVERNNGSSNATINFKTLTGDVYIGQSQSGAFAIDDDVNLTADTLFKVTNTGNVGIGVEAPDIGTGGQLKLDVAGNVGAVNYCDENGDNCFTATDATSSLWQAGSGDAIYYNSGTPLVGIGTATPDEALQVVNGNVKLDGDQSLQFKDPSNSNIQAAITTGGTYQMLLQTGGATRMSISNANHVTIGAVTSRLTLYGDTFASGIDMAVRRSSLPISSYIYTTTNGGSYPFDNWENLIIGAASGKDVVIGRSNQLVVGSSGSVGIGDMTPDTGTGGQLKLDVTGNVGAEQYCDEVGNNCFDAEDVTGINLSVADDKKVLFNDSGVLAPATGLYFESATGNVGIGAATPAYKLDVNGTGRINGILFDSTRRIFAGGTITYQTNSTTLQHRFTNAIGTNLTDTLLQIDTSSTDLDDVKLLNVLNQGKSVLTAVSKSGGGIVGIGDDTPDTGTGGQLKLDVEGPVGGTKYCDADGNDCFTAADASGLIDGSSGLWRASAGDTIYYDSGTPLVGIGTDDPDEQLHLTGNLKFGTHASVGNAVISPIPSGGIKLKNQFNMASDVPVMEIRNHNDQQLFFINDGGNTTFGSAASNSVFKLRAAINTSIHDALVLDSSVGTSLNRGMGILFNPTGSTNGARIAAGVEGATPGTAYLALSTGTAGTLSEKMRITSAGNVGIGTDSPSNTLDVDGTFAVIDQNTGSRRLQLSYPGSVASVLTTGTDDLALGVNSIPVINIDADTGIVANTMILQNGNVGIGDSTPDSGTGGQLRLDVEGPIGGTKYCDADGNNCFDAEAIAGGAGGLFENVGNVVRPKSGPVDIATDDFVFGSLQLNDDAATTDDDDRMFFDKSQAAFRVGRTTGTQWNLRGTGSIGMGINTTASANYSVAIGTNSSATSPYGVVIGANSTASGGHSFAIGQSVLASQASSIALGQYVESAGASSFAVGLQTQNHAVNRPKVTGDRSMALFMDGDTANIHSGYNVTGSDLFAIIGGRALIDPTRALVDAASGLDLHVQGELGAQQYCDEGGNNCFDAADVTGISLDAADDTRMIYNDSGVLATATDFVFDSATGFVGIGTASPGAALHVSKSTSTLAKFDAGSSSFSDIRNVAGNYVFRVTDASGATRGQVSGRASGVSYFLNSGFGIGDSSPEAYLEISANGASGGSAVMVSSDDNGDGDLLNILTDGNIGIGDTTPDLGTGGQLKLDVEGPIGGTKYCDEAGNNCFTAAAASGLIDGSSGLWRASAGDAIYYDSGTPRVGIGTDSPATPLHVKGNSTLQGNVLFRNATILPARDAATIAPFWNNSTDGSREGGLVFYAERAAGMANAGSYWASNGGPYWDFNVGNSANFDIDLASNSALRVGGASSPTFTVYENGTDKRVTVDGKVGIGTDSPSEILQINAGTGGTAKNTIKFSAGGWSDPGAVTDGNVSGTKLDLFTSLAQNNTNQIGMSGAGNMWFRTGGSQQSGFVWYTASDNTSAPTARMSITNSGNVGIGDTTPNSGTGGQLKLDVEGPIGGTKYCDENGDNCFAAASVSGLVDGSSGLWRASGNDSIYYNSGTPLVGIGTDDPDTTLHVADGDIKITNAISVLTLDATTSFGRDLVITSNGSTSSIMQQNGQLALGSNSEEIITLNPSAFNQVLINAANVGIGTTTPSSMLDLVGSETTITLQDNHDGNWSYDQKIGALSFRHNDLSSSGPLEIASIEVVNNRSGTTSYPGSGFVFNTKAAGSAIAEAMRITDSGTVGIGDVTPDTGTGGELKLDVEGPIGGTQYCDENGDNCFAAASVSGLVDGSSGLWRASAGDSIYYNSGTPLVGIGTDDPTNTLEVTGTVNVNGTLSADVITSNTTGSNNELFGTGLTRVGNNVTLVGTNIAQSYSSDVVAVGYNITAGSRNSVYLGNGITGPAGSGSHYVVIGDGAEAASNQSVVIGGEAGPGFVSIGYQAVGGQGIAIGNGATTTSTAPVAIGLSSSAGGRSVAIGTSSISNTHSVVLGHSAASTGNNQFIAGSSSSPITNVYIGKGVTNAAPEGTTYHATGGSGTDVAGANLGFAAGRATGNAAGGSVIFSTSDAGASGTTLQSLSERMRITSAGNVGIGTAAPARDLHVHDSGPSTLMLTNDASGQTTSDGFLVGLDSNGASASIFNYEAGSINFGTGTGGGPAIRMSITPIGHVGIGTTSPDTELDVAGDVSAERYCDEDGLNCFAAASVSGLVDGSSGLWRASAGDSIYYKSGTPMVGIGTDSPAAMLDVSGNGASYARIAKNMGALGYTSTTGAGIELNNFYTTRFGIFVDNGNNFQIENRANGQRVSFHLDDFSVPELNVKNTGSVFDPSIALSAVTGDEVGFYLPATNQMGFITDRTERMRIDATGNVGIGTTAPGARLDVSANNPSATAAYAVARVLGQPAGSAGAVTGDQIGFLGQYNVQSGATGADRVIGVSGMAINNKAVTTNAMYGLFGTADSRSGGTVDNAAGVGGYINNSSVITNSYGVQIPDIANSGTIMNTYGVYVGDVTTGTQTNTPYSFYAADANALNYFAGRVGVGGVPSAASATYGLRVSRDVYKGTAVTTPTTFFGTKENNNPIGLTIGTIGGATSADKKVYLSANEVSLSTLDMILQKDGGNVGIGTTTPDSELDVAGDVSAERYCDENGANCFAAADVGTGLWSAGSGDSIYYNSGTPKVGIGTASPLGVLHIKDAAPTIVIGSDVTNSGTQSLLFSHSSSGFAKTGIFVSPVGSYSWSDMNFAVNGETNTNAVSVADTKMQITRGGVKVTGSFSVNSSLYSDIVLFNPGSSANGTFINASVQNAGTSLIGISNNGNNSIPKAGLFSNAMGSYGRSTGLHFAINNAADSSALATNGSDTKMFISPTGNVGIGTTSPAQKLDVVGSAIFGQSSANNQVEISPGGILSVRTSTGSEALNVLNGTAGLKVSPNQGYLTLTGNSTGDTTALKLWPAVSDGATAVAYKFNTMKNLADAGAKLMSVQNSSTEHFVIKADGSVGIRTSAPDSELDVAGDVSAERYCDEDGANCFAAASVSGLVDGSSGLWRASAGDAIYYDSGTPMVGVGTDDPETLIHMTKATTGSEAFMTLENSETAPGNSISIDFRPRGTTSSAAKMIVTGQPSNGSSIDFETSSSGAQYSRLSISSTGHIKLMPDNAFTTSKNEKFGLYISNERLTAGDGNYGAGISFGRLGVDTKTASIVPVQETGNSYDQGIAFFPSTGTFNDPLVEAMRVTYEGNVGIGDSTPDNGTGGQLRLDVEGPIGGTKYCDENGDNCFAAASVRGLVDGSSGLWRASAGDAIYYDSGTPKVGIGTDDPQATLDVASDTDATALLGRTQIGGAGYSDAAVFSHIDLANSTDYAIRQIDTGHLFLNRPTGQNMYFRMNNADQMILSSSGNVGIGTTAPSSKLHIVNGASVATDTAKISSTYNIGGGNSLLALNYSAADLGAGLGVTNSAFGPGIFIDKSTSAANYAGNVRGLSINAAYQHTRLSGTSIGEGMSIVASNNTAASGVLYGANISATANTAGATAVGLNITASSTLGTAYAALFSGGNVGIGTTTPDTELDVAGDVSAENYCDANGDNCFTASEAGHSVWEIDTNVMRPTSGTADYATDDFVFGSPQLDYDGSFAHRNRMFFDKSKGAFRAGEGRTEWNAASVGYSSVAMGSNATASNDWTFAMGSEEGATASGVGAIAMGNNQLASGPQSIAIGGSENVASGERSYSMGANANASGKGAYSFGFEVQAGSGTAGDGAGDGSVVFGLQTEWQSINPQVTGDRSLALFMDEGIANANSGLDITGSDLFAIIGGRALIDPTRELVNVASGLDLHVQGNVGAQQYCDEGGDNCFAAASVSGLVDGSSGLWRASAGDAIYYDSGTPKVGIGTDAPAEMLDVAGNVNVDGSVFVSAATTNEGFYKRGSALGLRLETDNDVKLQNNLTAIWLLSTDVIRLRTNNQDRMVVSPTGNVGIGTITPVGTLDITSGLDQVHQRITPPLSQTANVAEWYNAAGTVGLAMDKDGKVGIGTAAPATALDVVGDVVQITATSPVLRLDNNQNTGGSLGSIDFERNGYLQAQIEATRGGHNTGNLVLRSGDGTTLFDTMTLASSGNVGIGTPTAASALHVVGDIRLSGILIDVSDRRLKTDIVQLREKGSMLEKLDQITGYSFRMADNTDGTIEYGLMAQDVEQVFPELVKTADDEIGTKSLNATGLIAPLVEAVKELKAENAVLKDQMEDLLAIKVASLKEENADLKAQLSRQAELEVMVASMRKDMAGLKNHVGGRDDTNRPWIILLLLLATGGFGYFAFAVSGGRQQNGRKD